MESAPERSKPALKQLEAAFGMIPNIAGVMANSAVLINTLVAVFGNVHGGSFTEPQVQQRSRRFFQATPRIITCIS